MSDPTSERVKQAALITLMWDGKNSRDLLRAIAEGFGLEDQKPAIPSRPSPIVNDQIDAMVKLIHEFRNEHGSMEAHRMFASAILAEADRRAAARLEPAELCDTIGRAIEHDPQRVWGSTAQACREMAARIRAKEARP